MKSTEAQLEATTIDLCDTLLPKLISGELHLPGAAVTTHEVPA